MISPSEMLTGSRNTDDDFLSIISSAFVQIDDAEPEQVTSPSQGTIATYLQYLTLTLRAT